MGRRARGPSLLERGPHGLGARGRVPRGRPGRGSSRRRQRGLVWDAVKRRAAPGRAKLVGHTGPRARSRTAARATRAETPASGARRTTPWCSCGTPSGAHAPAGRSARGRRSRCSSGVAPCTTRRCCGSAALSAAHGCACGTSRAARRRGRRSTRAGHQHGRVACFARRADAIVTASYRHALLGLGSQPRRGQPRGTRASRTIRSVQDGEGNARRPRELAERVKVLRQGHGARAVAVFHSRGTRVR